MRPVAAISIVLPITLSACASVTNFELGTADHTAAIVNHIQCELADAYRANAGRHPWLSGWAVGYKLTYKADATLTGNVGPQWSIPIQHTLAGGLTLTGERVRQMIVEYTNNFPKLPCSPSRDEAGVVFNGDLKIAKSLRDALATAETKTLTGATDEGSGRPDLLSLQISFAATYDALAKPNFTLVNLTLGGSGEAKKIDTNTLDLVFTKIPTPAPTKPLPVYLVAKPNPVTKPPRTLSAPPSAAVPPIDDATRQKILQGFFLLDEPSQPPAQ